VSLPVTEGRLQDIDPLVQPWLAEVSMLRGEVRELVPEHGDMPDKAYRALLAVRAALDRVEEILSNAVALRSGAEMSARDKADLAATELDRAIVARSARARDFESARERIAAASIDVIQYTQQARAAQKLADQAISVEARIRLAHRGLDATRSDMTAVLRHLAWESSMDR
jgi:hypothetical protein